MTERPKLVEDDGVIAAAQALAAAVERAGGRLTSISIDVEAEAVDAPAVTVSTGWADEPAPEGARVLSMTIASADVTAPPRKPYERPEVVSSVDVVRAVPPVTSGAPDRRRA